MDGVAARSPGCRSAVLNWRPVTPPTDPEVAEAFAAFEPPLRERLLELRAAILAAAERAEIEVVETLKWGQPSYLPAKPRTGSTVRLGQVGEDAAMFFHCQTTLVEEFRATFGDRLRTQRNRALLWRVDEPVPPEIVERCATPALRYHVRRRSG